MNRKKKMIYDVIANLFFLVIINPQFALYLPQGGNVMRRIRIVYASYSMQVMADATWNSEEYCNENAFAAIDDKNPTPL